MTRTYLFFFLFIIPCISFSQPVQRNLADVNGDGTLDKIEYREYPGNMVDIIVSGGTSIGTYGQPSIFVKNLDRGYPDQPWGFADVNSDGMADFITYRGGGNDANGNPIPIVQYIYYSTGTGLSPTVKVVNSKINAEAQVAIRWGWGDNGAPDNLCALDEIAPGIKREANGPRACFEKAIAASKAGNDGLALRWIVTTQCHNISARNSLLQGGIETVKYLMNTYGGGYTNNPKLPSTKAPAVTYVTFIATEDCFVGTRADALSAWETFSLEKGKSRRKEVPNGKRLLYGTCKAVSGPNPAMSLVISSKGSVGQGETVYVQ